MEYITVVFRSRLNFLNTRLQISPLTEVISDIV